MVPQIIGIIIVATLSKTGPHERKNTKRKNCRFLSVLVFQCMDLAEYRTLFVLSFTTPAFDPDVAPSFGTLLATINMALSMLSEVRVQ